MKVIDISNYQPYINLQAIKDGGINAVYIKATEGVDYTDPLVTQHMTNAKSCDMLFGFYHFMSEHTSPTGQAEDFYNTISNTGFNLLPVLDIENNNNNRTSAEITDRVLEFLNRFRELSGIDCIIYAGGYFARDLLDDRVKGYKAWIAHYGVDTPMETGFTNVVGHQYSDRAVINGYNGTLDISNFADDIIMNGAAMIQPSDAVPQRDNTSAANSFLATPYKIKLVQLLLNCLGYDLVTDGICGGNTTEAIGNFQTTYGLVVDYKFGIACFTKAYELIKGTTCGLSYTTPNATKVIQHILGIKVDGVFWYDTADAVIHFQNAKGITADSVVGAITWKYLLLG